jgi:sugar lactone lactonase YvrE
VSTLAGSTSNRGNADGTGTAATFSSPLGITRDGTGNLYVTDSLNNTIRRISSSGTVSTVAGSVSATGSANGTGSAARFNHPTGITADGAGNLYVADSTNNTIRKITPSGAVTTLAGLAGVSGFQDGSGSGALFNNPGGLAVDGSGNLFVADTGNSTIRKITPAGIVTSLAGLPGIAGLMDGTGSSAWFNQPQGLVLDSSGSLFVTDTGNAAIRKVTTAGIVTTVALSGELTGATSGGSPTSPATGSGTPATTGGTPAAGSSTSSTSGGSSGGGGALDAWLVAALGLACLLRRLVRRP